MQLQDVRIECERNEWILRYLEKGSEKSFNNFCQALISTRQGHLVAHMDQSIDKSRQVLAGTVPVSCTEDPTDTTSPRETTTKSTQGLSLVS